MPEEDEEEPETLDEAMGVEKEKFSEAWEDIAEEFSDEGEIGVDIRKSHLLKYIQENYDGDLKDMLLFAMGEWWGENKVETKVKRRLAPLLFAP